MICSVSDGFSFRLGMMLGDLTASTVIFVACVTILIVIIGGKKK